MKTFIAWGLDYNMDYFGSHSRKMLGVIHAKDKQSAFDFAKNNLEGFTHGYDHTRWSVDFHDDGAYIEEVTPFEVV